MLGDEARDGRGLPGAWRGEADRPEDMNIYYRCITRGPLGSIIPVIYNNYRIFEYACHEANYATYDILSGARAQEAAEGQ